jgi:hypothetical protein
MSRQGDDVFGDQFGLTPPAAVAKALACQGFVETSATADSSSGELNR